MAVERTAKLHPALYYKGLLEAARRRKITICGKAPVSKIERQGAKWRLETARGTIEIRDEPGFGYAIAHDFIREITVRQETIG